MEQIFRVYCVPKEIVTAIIKRSKNTKVKVRSPDKDTDFFDIVAPYLFIIFLDNELRTSIALMRENGFTLKKVRSRQYPAQTIMDVD